MKSIVQILIGFALMFGLIGQILITHMVIYAYHHNGIYMCDFNYYGEMLIELILIPIIAIAIFVANFLYWRWIAKYNKSIQISSEIFR